MAGRGIAHVGLNVSDLSRSSEFYTQIVGLKAEIRKREVARFSIGRDVLVLHTKNAGASDFHFGFRVDHPSKVDQWRAWLRDNEIPVHEDVAHKNKYSIKIRDPDGHWIEISYEK